ncbi:hypothetical protein LSH36_152g01016 [Paralvinella palmiformis]|uniref:Uncharacterized protein n=1 Tax=Paralvinella palmiformis TaxID=53620 RepID=A0AAD9JVB4_9ANNE|nr:hypothetical protein LSH36_152g01016 [Paralvinella palmiformis]
MRENLIFTGIAGNDEETEEDIRQALLDHFNDLDLDRDNIEILYCHRIPSFGMK